jgi:hypothetical protein
MPDEVAAERVATMADAARVPLEAAAAARVARAVTPTVVRLANEPIDFAFETEPSSFVAVQQQELDR